MSKQPYRWNPQYGYPMKWHQSRIPQRGISYNSQGKPTGIRFRPRTTKPNQWQTNKLARPFMGGHKPPYAPMGRGSKRRELSAGGHLKWGQKGHPQGYHISNPFTMHPNMRMFGRMSAYPLPGTAEFNARHFPTARKPPWINKGNIHKWAAGGAIGIGALGAGAYALNAHRHSKKLKALNLTHGKRQQQKAIHASKRNRTIRVRRGAHGRFAGSY